MARRAARSVSGHGRRWWFRAPGRRWPCGLAAAHALAPDELQHRPQRPLGLAQLAQQAPRGIDLVAAIVRAGHDHPARRDLGVERLKVHMLTGADRRLDVKLLPDLVGDLLAQLELDALGTALQRRVTR